MKKNEQHIKKPSNNARKLNKPNEKKKKNSTYKVTKL
jgi:hypothetical protein